MLYLNFIRWYYSIIIDLAQHHLVQQSQELFRNTFFNPTPLDLCSTRFDNLQTYSPDYGESLKNGISKDPDIQDFQCLLQPSDM
jgi:hypothetical protein